jgi:hypothetical protein
MASRVGRSTRHDRGMSRGRGGNGSAPARAPRLNPRSRPYGLASSAVARRQTPAIPVGVQGEGEHDAMPIAVEWLVALCFLVMGLSHILQPRAWAEFFIRFREKGAVGSLQLGLLHLPLALLIVAFHNIWQGVPLLVTLIGWSQLLKSFLYLVYPRHGLRMLGFVSIQQSWRFVVAGIFSVALSALIATSLATRG